MQKDVNIIQIGFGNMGCSFLYALLEKNKVQAVHIVEKDAQKLKAAQGIKKAQLYKTLSPDVFSSTGIIYLVLAVKPQDFSAIAADLSLLIEQSGREQDIVVLSMMAGITTASIAAALPCTNIARIMPSLCVAVHTAVIALCFRKTRKETRKQLSNMLEQLGLVVEIPEEHISIITALSGSGIAFVMEFIDALGQAGRREGLSLQDALTISQTVVEGAAKLLKARKCTPREIIDQISSPAGTTVEGMYELESGGFTTTIKDAVRASLIRAEELSMDNALSTEDGACSCDQGEHMDNALSTEDGACSCDQGEHSGCKCST